MLQAEGGPAAGISKGRIHANPCGDRVRDVSRRVDRRNETGTSVPVKATVLAGRVRPNRAADPRYRPNTATSDGALRAGSRNTFRQGPGVHAGGKKITGERRRRMGARDDRPGILGRRYGVLPLAMRSIPAKSSFPTIFRKKPVFEPRSCCRITGSSALLTFSSRGAAKVIYRLAFWKSTPRTRVSSILRMPISLPALRACSASPSSGSRPTPSFKKPSSTRAC